MLAGAKETGPASMIQSIKAVRRTGAPFMYKDDDDETISGHQESHRIAYFGALEMRRAGCRLIAWKLSGHDLMATDGNLTGGILVDGATQSIKSRELKFQPASWLGIAG